MREKKVGLLLKKNLILDFNDCYEDYFDDSFDLDKSNIIPKIKAFFRTLFKVDI